VSLDGRIETALDYMHAAKKEIARASESGNDLERQGCIDRAAEHLMRGAEELKPGTRLVRVNGGGRQL
jgi:hypothetical protein